MNKHTPIEQDQDARSLLVASYNIHKCVGLDMRRDPVRTLKVIAEIGADIVALQEADRRFGNKAGLLDLRALERETGLVPIPIQGIRHAHGWHGNLLLVRDALVEDVRQLTLPGFEPRGALVAELRVDQTPLRVIAAHLGLLPKSRLQQSRVLTDILGKGDERATLLMGDLNEWRDTPNSLHPLTQGYIAPGTVVRSYPARYPLLPLDRIMACPLGVLSDFTPHDTPLARVASDHLPIKARLTLPPIRQPDA